MNIIIPREHIEFVRKHKNYFLIGGGFLILSILIFAFSSGEKKPILIAPVTTEQVRISLTREAVPADIKVPEKGEKNVPVNIAIPKIVSQAAPWAKAKIRIFDIRAEGGKYIPDTVIVNKGDTVHINFTAVDREYDLTFPDNNMKQVAKKGETKIFEFQAFASWKYTYFCEFCGGLSGDTKGFIIIKE